MKRVRMLLRVSSDQQLEKDGDLSIQRKIVKEYVEKHTDWWLDEDNEYFEPGVSGYKNKALEREELQKILKDAQNKKFDILVLYKDDRIGRLMFDTTQYILNLKQCGVDVYTVKDGLISPDIDDIMGQVMLTFRYANAQKQSADTGMRVKDTAQKLVQTGKFMGGKAPYGYRLEYSGEISKHGRALKKLVVVPEEAEVVRYIYELSLNKEFGASKIAKILNSDERYKNMAPNDVWKGGTISSIIQNPVYAGFVAYKRRERINGHYHRLGNSDWITSEKPNEEIKIIDKKVWNLVQDKRVLRGNKYTKKLENQNVTVIKKNNGILPLIDVIHCGYCGRKLTNGSKYSYWTIKGTGERRANKIGTYKCQDAWSGVPHNRTYQFRADVIEPIIFKSIVNYIGKLQENESVFDEIEANHNIERKAKAGELKKKKAILDEISRKIEILQDNVSLALVGETVFSAEELKELIKAQKEKFDEQKKDYDQLEDEINQSNVCYKDWTEIRKNIPTWQEVFLEADTARKRALVNKLIDRIDVTKEKIVIKFKIDIEESMFQPRISGDSDTIPCKHGSV